MREIRSFYLWLLQFLTLLGLLALSLWLSLRPHSPSSTIVDVSIPTWKDGHNTTSPVNITYSLEVENPNKESGIYYDDIYLTFFYVQDTVGENKLPYFYQKADKTHHFTNQVDADERVWKLFLNAISNATTELKVALATRVRYKTWGVKSKYHHMNLQGIVRIGSDGKIPGKKKKVKLRHASSKGKLKAA